jgi:hypothetical protein
LAAEGQFVFVLLVLFVRWGFLAGFDFGHCVVEVVCFGVYDHCGESDLKIASLKNKKSF